MNMEEEADFREQLFHNTVREYIIFLLLFILLYVTSHATISAFKRRGRDEYYGDEEDATVYKISLGMCACSLAISVGAALLLPISIVSNEVLLLYPKSYYVKWLNSSLIHGLWNHIFLFSNLALFLLLPFAYLFTESEGFTGSRKGIMARVYETFVVLSLLFLVVLGMTYILSALIDHGKSSLDSLFNIWHYYLPFLYSCISFLGVLMLLLCTPLGFAKLFTVVGQFFTKPQFLRDVEEEYFTTMFEEDDLRRKLRNLEGKSGFHQQLQNGTSDLRLRLNRIEAERKVLEKRRKTSPLQSYVLYPLVMLLLFALTAIALLVVTHNTLQLLIGIKALPITSQQFSLGISSLSSLGLIGAALEIVLILYLILTSVVGFYTLPYFSKMQPKLHNTPTTHVITNCAVLLVLSSAVPLLSRTLGITNFDLLGDFGRIEWLGNFFIVLFYNVTFMFVVTLSLVVKFTTTMRREFLIWYDMLRAWWGTPQKPPAPPMNNGTAPTASKDD